MDDAPLAPRTGVDDNIAINSTTAQYCGPRHSSSSLLLEDKRAMNASDSALQVMIVRHLYDAAVSSTRNEEAMMGGTSETTPSHSSNTAAPYNHGHSQQQDTMIIAQRNIPWIFEDIKRMFSHDYHHHDRHRRQGGGGGGGGMNSSRTSSTSGRVDWNGALQYVRQRYPVLLSSSSSRVHDDDRDGQAVKKELLRPYQVQNIEATSSTSASHHHHQTGEGAANIMTVVRTEEDMIHFYDNIIAMMMKNHNSDDEHPTINNTTIASLPSSSLYGKASYRGVHVHHDSAEHDDDDAKKHLLSSQQVLRLLVEKREESRKLYLSATAHHTSSSTGNNHFSDHTRTLTRAEHEALKQRDRDLDLLLQNRNRYHYHTSSSEPSEGSEPIVVQQQQDCHYHPRVKFSARCSRTREPVPALDGIRSTDEVIHRVLSHIGTSSSSSSHVTNDEDLAFASVENEGEGHQHQHPVLSSLFSPSRAMKSNPASDSSVSMIARHKEKGGNSVTASLKQRDGTSPAADVSGIREQMIPPPVVAAAAERSSDPLEKNKKNTKKAPRTTTVVTVQGSGRFSKDELNLQRAKLRTFLAHAAPQLFFSSSSSTGKEDDIDAHIESLLKTFSSSVSSSSFDEMWEYLYNEYYMREDRKKERQMFAMQQQQQQLHNATEDVDNDSRIMMMGKTAGGSEKGAPIHSLDYTSDHHASFASSTKKGAQGESDLFIKWRARFMAFYENVVTDPTQRKTQEEIEALMKGPIYRRHHRRNQPNAGQEESEGGGQDDDDDDDDEGAWWVMWNDLLLKYGGVEILSEDTCRHQSDHGHLGLQLIDLAAAISQNMSKLMASSHYPPSLPETSKDGTATPRTMMMMMMDELNLFQECVKLSSYHHPTGRQPGGDQLMTTTSSDHTCGLLDRGKTTVLSVYTLYLQDRRQYEQQKELNRRKKKRKGARRSRGVHLEDGGDDDECADSPFSSSPPLQWGESEVGPELNASVSGGSHTQQSTLALETTVLKCAVKLSQGFDVTVIEEWLRERRIVLDRHGGDAEVKFSVRCCDSCQRQRYRGDECQCQRMIQEEAMARYQAIRSQVRQQQEEKEAAESNHYPHHHQKTNPLLLHESSSSSSVVASSFIEDVRIVKEYDEKMRQVIHALERDVWSSVYADVIEPFIATQVTLLTSFLAVVPHQGRQKATAQPHHHPAVVKGGVSAEFRHAIEDILIPYVSNHLFDLRITTLSLQDRVILFDVKVPKLQSAIEGFSRCLISKVTQGSFTIPYLSQAHTFIMNVVASDHHHQIVSREKKSNPSSPSKSSSHHHRTPGSIALSRSSLGHGGIGVFVIAASVIGVLASHPDLLYFTLPTMNAVEMMDIHAIGLNVILKLASKRKKNGLKRRKSSRGLMSSSSASSFRQYKSMQSQPECSGHHHSSQQHQGSFIDFVWYSSSSEEEED